MMDNPEQYMQLECVVWQPDSWHNRTVPHINSKAYCTWVSYVTLIYQIWTWTVGRISPLVHISSGPLVISIRWQYDQANCINFLTKLSWDKRTKNITQDWTWIGLHLQIEDTKIYKRNQSKFILNLLFFTWREN